MTREGKKSAQSGRRVPNSVILSALDRFCDAVYTRLTEGALGTLFSSYPRIENTMFGRFAQSDTRKKVFTPARRAVASSMESSALCGLYKKLISYLLCVRLKVYGVFVFSFLIYASVISAIGLFRGTSDDMLSVALPAIVSLGAVPTFFTGQTLAQALCSSYVGRFILKLTGIPADRLDVERKCGRGDAAFILALVCSAATLKFPFWMILAVPLVLAAVAVVFASPEFGTMILFFTVPLLPTWGLFGVAAVTIVAFLLKALLAKRVFRFEAVDVMLIPLIITFINGTLFGASHTALKSGLATVTFVLCYYLVVFTLATREWLRKCVVALIVSCSGISLYGLIQYVWQKNAAENMSEWVDEKMFGFIGGRAIATLENPNMLSVYLITVIPIAFMALIVLARTFRERVLAFLGLGVTGLCLIFTWSRGAWLGMLLSMMVFIIKY